MDIDEARRLIIAAKPHLGQGREPTIFSLGARGYYERPTTELLAFFLDPAQVHEMGTTFLRALLDCLHDSAGRAPRLRRAPAVEVTTSTGNLVDLMLLGEDWTLVLENKIYHGLDNPFADYETFATTDYAASHHFFVVLSPTGESPQNAHKWQALSYRTFLAKLREHMGPLRDEPNSSKWRLFADDFVCHLEEITEMGHIQSEALEFVLENMKQIRQLGALQERALASLTQNALKQLNGITGYDGTARHHTWPNGPALRFASRAWGSKSDVVLHLDVSGEHLKTVVRTYIFNITPKLEEAARNMLPPPDEPSWRESKGTILAYSWTLDGFDIDVVLKTLVNRSKLLMQLEEMRDHDG